MIKISLIGGLAIAILTVIYRAYSMKRWEANDTVIKAAHWRKEDVKKGAVSVSVSCPRKTVALTQTEPAPASSN